MSLASFYTLWKQWGFSHVFMEFGKRPVAWNGLYILKLVNITWKPFVMRCAIFVHFYNIKNAKNTPGGVLPLKVTLFCGCFICFLNWMLPNRAMGLISSWQLSLNSLPHFYSLIYFGHEDVNIRLTIQMIWRVSVARKILMTYLRQSSPNYSESVTLTASKTWRSYFCKR